MAVVDGAHVGYEAPHAAVEPSVERRSQFPGEHLLHPLASFYALGHRGLQSDDVLALEGEVRAGADRPMTGHKGLEGLAFHCGESLHPRVT